LACLLQVGAATAQSVDDYQQPRQPASQAQLRYWTHGIAAGGGAPTVDFTGTLTGFAGRTGSELGLGGTLTSISATGSPCTSGDFVIDGNSMLSPNNTTRNWNGSSVSSSTGYTSKSAIYGYTSESCTITTNLGAVTVTFGASGLHHWRAMTGTAVNPDNPASNNDQLTTQMEIGSGDSTGQRQARRHDVWPRRDHQRGRRDPNRHQRAERRVRCGFGFTGHHHLRQHGEHDRRERKSRVLRQLRRGGLLGGQHGLW
jgi:hypothetical protein